MASTTYGVDDPNRSQRWNPKADQWEEGFSRLGHYIERHGAPSVTTSVTVDGYPLGSWVDMQRNRHTKGAPRRRPRTPTPGPDRAGLGATR